MAKSTKVSKAVKEFIDPPSTKLQDWNWRPLEAVSKDLNLTEIPDYIQKGYGSFMADQAKRAAAGDLTSRDLLKAYLITQSSIGRQGLAHSTATKAGLKVPRTDELVRPEGAFATWLGSKAGQKYLDAAMKGDLDEKAIAEIQHQFSPFGKQNALGESMVYAAQTIPEMSKRLNQTIMGTPEDYRDYAEGLKGIAGSKSGFIGSMLGRGDLPTFDARQIYLHTAGEQLPTATPAAILNRGKGLGGREAVDRLAARQEALGLKIDPALDPYYQHLAHHAVWDKIGGDKTTHQDLIDAMTNYKDGGPVHMLGGGLSVFDQPTEDELAAASKAAYGRQRMSGTGVTRPEAEEPEEREPAVVKAYEPTWRQQIDAGMQAGLRKLGSPSNRARQLSGAATGHNEIGIGALDFVPFLGTAVSAEEAGRAAMEDLRQGDKLGAALSIGLGVLPGAYSTIKATPGATRALKSAVRRGQSEIDRGLVGQGSLANLMDVDANKARMMLREGPGRAPAELSPDAMRIKAWDSKIKGKAAGGQVQHMSTAGVVKSVARKIIKPTPELASKVYNEILGEKVSLTPAADRMIAIPGRSREKGGPLFSWLSTVDPDYAGWVWANKGPGATSKMINAAAENPGLIFTPQIGAPEMHRSNQVTYEKILRAFERSQKKGELTPELREAYNDRLKTFYTDENGNPLFNEDFDIAKTNLRKQANTFPQRAAIAEVLGGVGTREYGFKNREAAQIIPYSQILQSTTEPELLNASTGSLGPRMFRLSGERAFRPDLHAAFPEAAAGEDLGFHYAPTPRELVFQDFIKQIQSAKGRDPGHMDWDRNRVIQQVTPEIVQRLQDAGYKAGGPVHKGRGGVMKQAGQIIGKAAESSGMARPVTAAKDLTTLQDFHTSLGDRIREGVAEANKMMEGFDYKYDKGQRVFTEDSARKNKPPYTILGRTRVGNRPMTEDGTIMGKKIIDPETGKTKRTPYEPGYRVRDENGDEWSEFDIPATAIIGDVEMARGGVVYKAEGGQLRQPVDRSLPDLGAEERLRMEDYLRRMRFTGGGSGDKYGTGIGGRATVNFPVGPAVMQPYVGGGVYKPQGGKLTGGVSEAGVNLMIPFADGGEVSADDLIVEERPL